MDVKQHHLDDTLAALRGPTQAQITVNNQWAAMALDKFHQGSKSHVEIVIDGKSEKIELFWDSNFSNAAMKEDIYMAYHGGEALAMFVMSVLCGYKYLEQSEIGTGVDYCFCQDEPDDDSLNFLENSHGVEISGILQESKSNTLRGRIKLKHEQISKGGNREYPCSVIVTLFSAPITVKEKH